MSLSEPEEAARLDREWSERPYNPMIRRGSAFVRRALLVLAVVVPVLLAGAYSFHRLLTANAPVERNVAAQPVSVEAEPYVVEFKALGYRRNGPKVPIAVPRLPRGIKGQPELWDELPEQGVAALAGRESGHWYLWVRDGKEATWRRVPVVSKKHIRGLRFMLNGEQPILVVERTRTDWTSDVLVMNVQDNRLRWAFCGDSLQVSPDRRNLLFSRSSWESRSFHVWNPQTNAIDSLFRAYEADVGSGTCCDCTWSTDSQAAFLFGGGFRLIYMPSSRQLYSVPTKAEGPIAPNSGSAP